MHKDDVIDFADYEVYELVDNKYHAICVCKEHKMAELLTKMLAYNDPNNDAYYYTSITNPGELVIGGGWYISYKKGDDGQLHCSSLM